MKYTLAAAELLTSKKGVKESPLLLDSARARVILKLLYIHFIYKKYRDWLTIATIRDRRDRLFVGDRECWGVDGTKERQLPEPEYSTGNSGFHVRRLGRKAEDLVNFGLVRLKFLLEMHRYGVLDAHRLQMSFFAIFRLYVRFCVNNSYSREPAAWRGPPRRTVTYHGTAILR